VSAWLPRVVNVGAGGTIAAARPHAGDRHYQPGALDLSHVLADAPGSKRTVTRSQRPRGTET
jgi:hypothetical protein